MNNNTPILRWAGRSTTRRARSRRPTNGTPSSLILLHLNPNYSPTPELRLLSYHGTPSSPNPHPSALILEPASLNSSVPKGTEPRTCLPSSVKCLSRPCPDMIASNRIIQIKTLMICKLGANLLRSTIFGNIKVNVWFFRLKPSLQIISVCRKN